MNSTRQLPQFLIIPWLVLCIVALANSIWGGNIAFSRDTVYTLRLCELLFPNEKTDSGFARNEVKLANISMDSIFIDSFCIKPDTSYLLFSKERQSWYSKCAREITDYTISFKMQNRLLPFFVQWNECQSAGNLISAQNHLFLNEFQYSFVSLTKYSSKKSIDSNSAIPVQLFVRSKNHLGQNTLDSLIIVSEMPGCPDSIIKGNTSILHGNDGKSRGPLNNNYKNLMAAKGFTFVGKRIPLPNSYGNSRRCSDRIGDVLIIKENFSGSLIIALKR